MVVGIESEHVEVMSSGPSGDVQVQALLVEVMSVAAAAPPASDPVESLTVLDRRRRIRQTDPSTVGLALNASSSAEVELTWENGTATAIWGDGDEDQLASGVGVTHPYSPDYAGDVSLRLGPFTRVTGFESDAGAWSFTAAQLAAAFPSLELLDVRGDSSQVVSGDLADLPRSLDSMIMTGGNTLTGSVADLPSGMEGTLSMLGSAAVTGNLADLPPMLDAVLISSAASVITGDVANIPSTIGRLSLINGDHTVSGDLANLPNGLLTCRIRGNNTVTYSGGGDWSGLSRFFEIISGAAGVGLTTAEVDQLLIDINAAAVTPILEQTITITGNAEARSSASDAAVTALQTRGWTVTTN